MLVFHHSIKDLSLFGARRITDLDLQHEPVDLGLGQRIRPFLLDWILRCQHEKGIIQRVAGIADGHLALLHRLQQGALHLGRGTIDFVGQNQIGEDRPFAGDKITRVLLIDQRSRQVGGQQVRSELDAVEAGLDKARQTADCERLGEAGDTLEQNMSATEKADEDAFQHRTLADDDPIHLGQDTIQ